MVKTKRKKKNFFAPFLHFNVRLSVTMSFGGQIVVHPIRCPLNENWRSNKCTAVIINYTQGLPFFVLNTHNKINLSSIDKRLRQKYILKSKYIYCTFSAWIWEIFMKSNFTRYARCIDDFEKKNIYTSVFQWISKGSRAFFCLPSVLKRNGAYKRL